MISLYPLNYYILKAKYIEILRCYRGFFFVHGFVPKAFLGTADATMA